MLVNNLPIPSNPSHSIQDSTKIQAYQDCPRMYFYEYVLGWRLAKPNNHLHFGSAVHEAMEHIILHGYNTSSVMEAMEKFDTYYREEFPKSTDPIFSPKTPPRFFDMLILYLRTYHDDLERYQVYKTEFGGTLNLSESPHHRMAYKMDTILRDRTTGLYCSLEHKTKGGNYISDSYQYDFMLSIQLGTYTHVLNCLFPPEEVSGVIINCMCFKKTKKPDYILRRFPIPLTNDNMFNWLENTKSWLDKIHNDFDKLSTTTESDPRMNCFPLNGRSCTNWGRICAYHDLCTTWINPVQHQDQIPVDMEINFWNPLDEKLTEQVNV